VKKISDDLHLSMACSIKGKLSKRMLMTLFCFMGIVIVTVIVNSTDSITKSSGVVTRLNALVKKVD